MYQSFYNSSAGLCCHPCVNFFFYNSESLVIEHINLFQIWSLSPCLICFFPKKVNILINMLVTKFRHPIAIVQQIFPTSLSFINCWSKFWNICWKISSLLLKLKLNKACVKPVFTTNSLLLILWKPFFRKSSSGIWNNFLLLSSPFLQPTRTSFL